MDEITRAVLITAELREEVEEKIDQGILPDKGLLEVMAGLLEAVAAAFRLRLNTPEWEQFYRHMHSGDLPADFLGRSE